MSALYVGVGCLEAQWLPYAVLRHSIVMRTKLDICVEPLYKTGIDAPVPRDPRNQQKTPFSFQRFLVPEIRNYCGRAMYLDSDMLVFADIAALFDCDFGNSNVLAVPHETSVLLLDCEKLKWNIKDLVSDLDTGKLSYDGLMTCRSVARIEYRLPPIWNWLDNSSRPMPNNVAILHYTVTSSQPWVSSGHPLGHLWLKEFFAAVDDGSIAEDEVQEAVDRGFVRPSLLVQTRNRTTSKDEIPASVLAEDKPFAEYCRSVNYAIVEGFRK